ncbi:MAG TPA: SPOR domain-containing protein [Blastocatellia bacterium]|nr:SPOR domain-containing protein [Blastocatellia bacterium]
MTNATCPLCRRTISALDRPPAVTRLCLDCRTLVHTIVPGGKLSTAAVAVAPRVETAPQQLEVVLQLSEIAPEQIAHEHVAPPLVEDHNFYDDIVDIGAPIPAQFENVQTVEEDYQPFFMGQQDEQHHISDSPVFYADEPIADAAPVSEIAEETLVQAETDSSFDTRPIMEDPGPQEPPSSQQDLEQPARFEDYRQPEQTFAAAAASPVPAPFTDQATAPARAQQAADPWEEALPAWEYSRNEWPLVVDDFRPSLWTRMRTPGIIALALAATIALYYFVYRPLAEEGPPQVENAAPAPAVQEKAAAPVPIESRQAALQPPVAPTAVENAAPAAPSLPSSGIEQAEGAYTLQVAALPDEASATQYSERLARAGISTYIVPVESGRRKFFRVRVGRFKTADEAQKYAAQSRVRAREAGMSLDFMVTDYSKQ